MSGTDSSDRLEGLEVGAYTLERLLGRGGMGSVWLGHRTDGRFEGRVAVKLMMGTHWPLGVERFRREGTMLARLAHPGIARLLDAGMAPTRQPYLVLEYVDGEPIDRYALGRSLPIADRIGLILQVLDALAHAHANLVIHRDIKPSNILVTADGTAKLLDFGIGKLLDGDGGGSPLTEEGGRALTPDFAAPEQVLGDPITTATDVYTVGVLLYLLLSGRHPVQGRLHSPVTFPALVEGDPIRLGLGDLDSVLAMALKRAPEERYQTAVEFAEDLRRFLRQEPVRARPDSVAYRARKFVRRHRGAVVFGLMTALALIGAAAFSIQQMRVARLQRNEVLRSSRRELAMSELQGILAGNARGPDGKPLSPAGRIQLAEQVLNRRFKNDPWIVAGVTVDLAGRFFEAGDLEGQRVMLARARALADSAGLANELALASCTRAITYWLFDALDSARVDVDEAKAALARAEVPDADAQLACLEAEGKLLQATGNPDSGIRLLKQALAMVESDPNGSKRRQTINSLAEVLRLSGRTREAVPYFRGLLTDLEATGYRDTEAFPNMAAFLAASLVDLGEFASFDSLLGGLIRDRLTPNGEGPVPSLLSFLYGYGKVRLGVLDSGEVWIERAVRDTSEGIASVRRYLAAARAQLRLDQGRIPEARAAVAGLSDATRGQRATAAMLRARLRRAEGDGAGAATFLESELRTLWNDGKQRLTLFALPLVTAAEWRLARGDVKGADSLARLARDAAAIDELALTRSALAGRAELVWAWALRAEGDGANARKAADRAVVALGNGYGPRHRWTVAARSLADSLARATSGKPGDQSDPERR